jgi:uncharacterized membrane protein
MTLGTIYITLLRIIHIFSAVTWIGGVIFMISVVLPTVAVAGPDGGRFMLHVAKVGRLANTLTGAAISTVVAGLLLYWPTSGGLNPAWLSSPNGITLTIGALFGITTLLHGLFAAGPATRRMAVIANEILGHQGPPSPELLKQAQAQGAKIASLATQTLILGSLALLFMAAAQTI